VEPTQCQPVAIRAVDFPERQHPATIRARPNNLRQLSLPYPVTALASAVAFVIRDWRTLDQLLLTVFSKQTRPESFARPLS
jgi:hypothetical protein